MKKKPKVSVQLKRLWKRAGKPGSLRAFAKTTELYQKWMEHKKS